MHTYKIYNVGCWKPIVPSSMYPNSMISRPSTILDHLLLDALQFANASFKMCPELDYLKERGGSSRGQKTLSKLLYLNICKMRIIVITPEGLLEKHRWVNACKVPDIKNLTYVVWPKTQRKLRVQNINWNLYRENETGEVI